MEQKNFPILDALSFGIRSAFNNARTLLLANFISLVPLVVLFLFVLQKISAQYVYVAIEKVGALADVPLSAKDFTVTDKLLLLLNNHDYMRFFLLTGITLVFLFLFIAGLIIIGLDIYAGKPTEPKRIYAAFPLIYKILPLLLVYLLVVSLGSILFIIPGILYYIRFGWAFLFMLDKNVGVTESLRLSWRATQPYFWPLLAFNILVFLFSYTLLGSFLGSILMLVQIYLYKKLTESFNSFASSAS